MTILQIKEFKESFISKLKDDESVVRLSEKIKPLYNFPPLCFIEPVDLFKIAYTWNPKPAKKADYLSEITTITTYHQYAYYGFFKPSIAEVLVQIPDKFIDETVAFQIVEYPKTSYDLNYDEDIFNAGFQVAKTILYKKENI